MSWSVIPKAPEPVSILAEIVARIQDELPAQEARVSRAALERQIATRPTRPAFRAALTAPHYSPRIIAELKKASPSRGLIRSDFDPVLLARDLERAGAAALSILTEPHYFQGAPAVLHAVADTVSLPLLRKDFILSEYQLLEARAWGANAVLLIVAALEPSTLRTLLHTAKAIDLDVLCEIHDRNELEIAMDANADLIGINSRNLKTFHVDLELVPRLLQEIPPGIVRVVESGLSAPTDIARLRAAGADAFLIGEHLMRAPDPGLELVSWLAHPSNAGATDSSPNGSRSGGSIDRE